MTTHDLRCLPEYFAPVADGTKPFELRRDDRGYATGDVLRLREYDPATNHYTGKVVERRVTFVLRGGPWLAKGYVALGLDAHDPLCLAAADLRDAQAWCERATCEAESDAACEAADQAITAICAAVDALRASRR